MTATESSPAIHVPGSRTVQPTAGMRFGSSDASHDRRRLGHLPASPTGRPRAARVFLTRPVRAAAAGGCRAPAPQRRSGGRLP